MLSQFRTPPAHTSILTTNTNNSRDNFKVMRCEVVAVTPILLRFL